MADVDEFEEITLPEAREDYNTKLCSCQCHQDQQDEKLRRRIKHCYSCSLKIFDGKPVLKTSRNEYRPITVLYPLEEKEKLVKAKKEAAQLALAKARAQRQLKKRKGKKKNVGSLKSKNSKNIPLKKKFKKKRCKLQCNPAVVGNTGTSFTEAECESSNVKGGISAEKQDKSDLKSTCSKPGDDQDKTSSGKLTEITADVSGSSSVVMTVLDAENIGTQLTVSTTKGSGVATVSQASEEATGISAFDNNLYTSSSATKKEDTSKGDAEAHFNAELHSSRPSPAAVSSATLFPGQDEPVPSSVTPVASTISLGHCLASSDFKNNSLSVVNKQRPHMSTHELNVSQAQISPSLTGSVSCTSSTVTLSHVNSFDTPRAPFSQISSDRLNVNNANASLNKTVVSSQNNTFVSFGLQPRFSTSPMMASPRIPVLVTLAPIQYLPTPKSIAGNEMTKPRQTNPQMAGVPTSVFSPHQIKSSKPDGKLGRHGKETGTSHSVIYSHPVSTQTLTSSSSSVSSSIPISAVSTAACRVVQTDGCPASAVSDSSMDAKISTSTSSVSNFPSSFMHCDNQKVSISVSSSEKSDSAGDGQLSETISSLPSTPIKEKIPSAVLRAHLDNFSLGAFDASIGFSQLQQFSQSPSKYLTDSMSKFDLLALIESSNLGNKDFTLQSCFASSSSRTQAEPLLTFSGALEKLRANSEKPEETSTGPVHKPQSVSVPVTMENLPATPGGTGPHEQPSFDHEMGDDRKVHSIQETEDDLQNLCPKLNPSQMLLDDEASNAFVLSVWTEEQDRTILDTVIAEGVTQEVMKKLHSEIPAKSVEEINSRAKLLLDMLEQMGDTESDTDTDTSHVDASELPV